VGVDHARGRGFSGVSRRARCPLRTEPGIAAYLRAPRRSGWPLMAYVIRPPNAAVDTGTFCCGQADLYDQPVTMSLKASRRRLVRSR
jgi:hypothetical protein